MVARFGLSLLVVRQGFFFVPERNLFN